jgi:hypothetical protein
MRLAGGFVVALAERAVALDDDRADERVRTRMTLRARRKLDRPEQVLDISLGRGHGVH